MVDRSEAFRLDAVSKVTGQTLYAADYTMPGMLYVKTFWTEKIYAVVESIDTREAEAMPGVVRVITAKDIQGTNRANIFEPYDRYWWRKEGKLSFRETRWLWWQRKPRSRPRRR